MPRDGSGIYSTPPGTHGTPNTTILSANYNSNVDDVATDLNTSRPIVAGGTGATTAAGALTALGAVAKAGDTMTGDLIINKNGPEIFLNSTVLSLMGIGSKYNGIQRWGLVLGDGTAQTGGNVGNDFSINRVSDDGSTGWPALKIARSTGNVSIPSGGAVSPTSGGLNIGFPGSGGMWGIGIQTGIDATAYAVVFLNSSSTPVGTITTTATATAYGTSSAAELKEDLKSFDAGNIIDNTEVYDFKWRTTGERAYGVIAQQANEVYPQAVIHMSDKDWWGVDYSKYVPVLLQELKALRARVATLEGGFSGKPA